MAGMNTVKGLEEAVSIWQKGAHGEFQLALNKPVASRAEAYYNRIAPSFESNYVTENFPGLFGVAELEEFKGEIPYSGLDNYDNSIVSTEYARGLAIRWRDLRADQKNLALLQNLPSILAMNARKRKFKNMVASIESNPTWSVDSLSLFNDNHFFGDNNIAVTVSDADNPSEDDWRLILDAVWDARGRYVNDHGDPLEEIFDIAQLCFMAHAKYGPSARRAMRNMNIPVAAGSGGAAIPNIDPGTWDMWPSSRWDSSSNVLYGVFTTEEDDAGNPLGKSVPALRTEFTPYEMNVAGGSPDDPVFRNKRRIEMNVYGEEGFGIIDATRWMKITLSE